MTTTLLPEMSDQQQSPSSEIACIDEALQQILAETDLLAFQSKLVFDKQLTRLEHFYHVTDMELKTYGLSEPAIRRLRAAIERKRKKRAKLFGTGKRSVRLVQLKRTALPADRPGFEFNTSQPFLIPKNEIKLMETLGEGNFSVVKRAQWIRSDGSKLDCAVKILHEMSEAVRQDLAGEISNMQKLRHQNLVQLFGVAFAESTLMVIEFCEGGSLLDRLRDQSKVHPLVSTLLNYAQQIATGMSYLESRRCVHRDLAARNVLLAHEEQIIKICDFGLARALSENERLYIMQEPKKVPFSWCPPESLRFRQFSHKSDVWAFGVTMWELYTYGEEPWIGSRAAEVLQLIESGQRLRKPDFCPQELYEIMKMCWSGEAEERPKFSHLRKLLMDVKFMPIVCRTPCTPTADGQQLGMSPGDELLLIGERANANDLWFGQSVVTRRFGHFPRSSVAMRSGQQQQVKPEERQPWPNSQGMALAREEQGPKMAVSFPIAGSFIHTGHGDIDERLCWGHVDKIDQIYLKNPIVGPNTLEGGEGEQVKFVPSILNVHEAGTKAVAVVNNGTSSVESNGSPNMASVLSTSPFPSPSDGLPARTSSAALLPPPGSPPLRLLSNGTSTVSSISSWGSAASSQRSSASKSLVLSRDAFEWISNELAQLSSGKGAEGFGGKNSRAEIGESSLNVLNPPPQPKAPGAAVQAGQPATSSSSSKYDSSFSIPRPNRTSPVNRLTPPFASTQSFSTAQPLQQGQGPSSTSYGLMKSSSASLPSSTSTLNALVAIAGPGKETTAQNQRPSSTHSMFNEFAMQKGGDDPFWVKEEVKTLTANLSYKDVHNASHFLNNGTQSNGILYPSEPAQSAPTTSREGAAPAAVAQQQLHNQRPTPNVAVVAPLPRMLELERPAAAHQQAKTTGIADGKEEKKPSSSSSTGRHEYEGLLPPPSQLLLSGLDVLGNPVAAQQKGGPAGPALHYQPIFNISGHSTQQSMNQDGQAGSRPRLRYGSNGIPILDPVPVEMPIRQQPEPAKSRPTTTTRMVTLGELDTEALFRRVREGVDFASQEQCRQCLLRNGFDVDRTIRELKIEKLLEMGLATDRDLAASALDSEQWDVNAAANRLCCS